jgi:hypothetical protein
MKIEFMLMDDEDECILEKDGFEYIPPIGTEVWFTNTTSECLDGEVKAYNYNLVEDHLIIICKQINS